MVRFPSPINGDEDILQFLKPNLVRSGNISSQGYCTDKLDCGWELLRLRDNMEQDPAIEI